MRNKPNSARVESRASVWWKRGYVVSRCLIGSAKQSQFSGTMPIRRSAVPGAGRAEQSQFPPCGMARGGKTIVKASSRGDATRRGTNARNKANSRPSRVGRVLGDAGHRAKQSQFDERPLGSMAIMQNEPNSGALAGWTNKANSRWPRYPTIPLFHHSGILILLPPCETKPILPGVRKWARRHGREELCGD